MENLEAIQAIIDYVIDKGRSRAEFPILKGFAMSTRKSRISAFIKGWAFGNKKARHEGTGKNADLSATDALELFPHLASDDVDCFINGVSDGVTGDTWRLCRARIIGR